MSHLEEQTQSRSPSHENNYLAGGVIIAVPCEPHDLMSPTTLSARAQVVPPPPYF
eukprot:m.26207 g.26207  ORF g.26207 m.26207 type:complete len:55 (-) comp13285_c0_seq1:18-182(-)